MDECETPVIKPDLTKPLGDVDDFIFAHNSDWYASDR